MRQQIGRFAVCVLVLGMCAATAADQAAKVPTLELKDLPVAVQKTVKDSLKGGEIKHISKETEGGRVQYEVESILGGRTRDFDVDTKGTLLLVEEATAIDAIPAAAKAAILKKVGTGKLAAVETYLKTGQAMAYEASYTDKSGKAHEVLVKADGTERKE